MDPLAAVLATLQLAITVALLFLLPGVTWAHLLAPATGPLARLGRAVGVSLLTTSTACIGLAYAGMLRPPITVATLVVLTLAPLGIRSVRQGVRRELAPLRRPTARQRRWWLAATAGAGVIAALVVIPSRLRVGETLLPFTSTVWYYVNLARVVAERGGFPATLPEWGTARPFQLDYLPVTAHAAAALQLFPGDLLVQLEAYRLAILVAGLAAATLVFRRWVSSWIALLGAVLLLATTRLEFRFLSYKPETFGLVLVLVAIWAADRAIVERSWRLGGLALASSTLAFLAHAEVFLILGPALLGLVAARAFVSPRGGALGLRARVPPRMAVGAALAVAVFGGAVVLGSAVNLALTGELRVLGYVSPDRLAGETSPPPPDEIPPGWVFTDDPTWDFYVAAVSPGQVGSAPPGSFFDAQMLPRSLAAIWPGLDGRIRSMLVVLAILVAAPVVGWPWLDVRRRRALVTWWTFGAALFAGAYLLYLLADTYVPQRTGPRRLMAYELMLPVTAMLVLLWSLDRLLRAGWRALLPRRGAMQAAGLALAVITAVALAPAPDTDPSLDLDRDPGLTAVGYEVYRWIDANLPQDARILANAYTDGSLAGISGRTGIIDGRAVYLEDRSFLAESTALVLGARVVFQTPAGPGAARYLARERVAYLLVGGADASGADLGGYGLFATDLHALESSDRYTLLRTFGDGRLLLFEVRRPS